MCQHINRNVIITGAKITGTPIEKYVDFREPYTTIRIYKYVSVYPM